MGIAHRFSDGGILVWYEFTDCGIRYLIVSGTLTLLKYHEMLEPSLIVKLELNSVEM